MKETTLNDEPEELNEAPEAEAPPRFETFPNDTLETALARHAIELPADQRVALDRYCQVMWEWNEKINLTRHTDYERFVARDVVDTLQLANLILPNEEVIDIGSGGGVPGIPLAILRPDLTITLTESIGKKAKVLADMVKQLKLPIRVEPRRAEKIMVDERFDVTTARGVGSLHKMLTWLKDHWLSVGRLLAIKGPKWKGERGEARHYNMLLNLELRVAATYPMAGTHSDSVILKIWPKGATEK
jgi:16S rRNA (guanine527-N7)-methyltransferase